MLDNTMVKKKCLYHFSWGKKCNKFANIVNI